MRVLLITARYLPHVGGLEQVVESVTAHLHAQHAVHIVTNRQPRTLPAAEQIGGIAVTRLFFLLPRWRYLVNERAAFVWGALVTPITLFQLARLIAAFKPDVVNVHYPGNTAFFVWFLHRLLGFRLVISLHGSDVWHEAARTRFDRWLLGALCRRADAVTACSRALLEAVSAIAPEVRAKGTAIYNGVDDALFAGAPPYAHSKPYIFAVGRLIPRKGFAVLLDAFAQVSAEADIDLLIAGDGAQRADLEAQIARLGLTERVHLLGTQTRPAVAALMRGAAVIAVPSWEEAFGIVVIEGMAAGRPLVVARLDGMVEAAGGASVAWVAPRDADDLARGLRAALAAPLPSENQALARQADWATVSARYAAVLAQAAHLELAPPIMESA